MERLGQFRILSKIGQGGMGAVYRAHDEQLQRDVAIKLLPQAELADATAKARLLREARAAAGLSHPNICVVHEVGEASGQAYIAMECIDGEPLNERIARSPLTVAETIRFGIQLADALAHAHERGVVHRDLKPSNVIVTDSQRLKVLDFGLAKRIIDSVGAESVTDVMVTAAGVITGTPAYMSPEQLRGRAADARSDIWSAGVMFHEMLTGSRPFGGTTLAEISASILTADPAPLPPEFPVELRTIVARCLEKEPGSRYQSAAELRSALELVQMTGGTTVVPHRVSPALIATALAVLVVVVAAIVYRDRITTLISPPAPKVAATSAAQPPLAAVSRAVAVLPFSNFSGAEDEYLADGMQDAIIGGLARVKELRVLSRTSTVATSKPGKSATEIAKLLGVDNLVEGSVAHAGDRLRVEVKLIRTAPEERQVWSEVYERDMRDVLALYGDIATAVAAQIDSTLVATAKVAQGPARKVDPEVYKLYLRGLYQLHKGGTEGFKNGLALLRQAIERDPADPLPYAGLAEAYALRFHDGLGTLEDLELARAAAKKSESLDPNVASSFASIALINMFDDWDWTSTRSNFQRALELNSSLAEIRRQYAWFLMTFKESDEALAQMKRARDTEPTDGVYYADIAWFLEILGRPREALAEVHKAAKLSPENPYVLYVLGLVESKNGHFDEAIRIHRGIAKAEPFWEWALGYSYVLAGRDADADSVIRELKKSDTADAAFGLAEIYAGRGDKDEAMHWVEVARAKHQVWTAGFGIFAELAPLRGDPRFEKFLASMKLPNVEPGWPGKTH